MNSRFEDDLAGLLLARPGRSRGAGRYVERLRLPVAVRGPDEPDGVPLERILAAAQEAAATVDGLAIAGNELTVTHRERPADRDRRRLHDLLGDRERLLALAAADDAVPGEATLRDDALPDAEWIRLFRRWAVAELITRDGDG